LEEGDIEKSHNVLKYNDDLEDLGKLGYFKYIAYPFKVTLKYVRNKTACCRRRIDGYISQTNT